jgi:hypothetical protein
METPRRVKKKFAASYRFAAHSLVPRKRWLDAPTFKPVEQPSAN